MCSHQEMEWLLLCICQLCRPSSWGFESCTIVSLPLGERPICQGRSFDLRIQRHEKKCRISSHHWLWNSRKASKTQFLSQFLINLFNTPSFPVRFLLHSHIQDFPQGSFRVSHWMCLELIVWMLDTLSMHISGLQFTLVICCRAATAACGGRPLESLSSNPLVRPRTPQIEGGKNAHRHLAHTLANVAPRWQLNLHVLSIHSFSLHIASRAPAGSAAAMRCQSWWWATSGICSDSASCPAGQCRSSWRRRGNAATWSALQNSTGTSCCSSKSCWASPWHGACARTTPPSACRGLYRGTAAPSCDPESSLHFADLRSGEKGLLILMTGNIPCGLLLYWADFS